MAMDSVDVRLARLEGSYQQIDRRLGSIGDRLGRLETKVDAAVDRLDAKMGLAAACTSCSTASSWPSWCRS